MPDAHSLNIFLLTSTVSIATFSAIALLYEEKVRRAGWGLALFLLVSAFDTMVDLLIAWGKVPKLVSVFAFGQLVTMLYGPAIYLYVLSITKSPPSWYRATLTLTLPVLPLLALIIAAIDLPPEVQWAMIDDRPIADPAFSSRAQGLATLMEFTFLFVTLGFVLACWRLILSSRRKVASEFSSYQSRTLAWVSWVLVLILFAWSAAAAEAVLPAIGFLPEGLTLAGLLAMLTWVSLIGFFGVRQRHVLYEPVPVLIASATSLPPSVSPAPAPEKYLRSALDSNRMQRIAERMEALMRQDAAYKDPSLSLRRLADRLGASTNHISQTLNDHLGISFFDYVNRYRVDEAERLLRNSDLSATEIALEVGFNSRSTFNAAVRKHRNLSPTELRNRG